MDSEGFKDIDPWYQEEKYAEFFQEQPEEVQEEKLEDLPEEKVKEKVKENEEINVSKLINLRREEENKVKARNDQVREAKARVNSNKTSVSLLRSSFKSVRMRSSKDIYYINKARKGKIYKEE